MSQATSGRFFPITTYSLGPGASFANTYADLESYGNGQYPRTGELGAVVEYQSKVYRLVKFSSGTGAVASTVGGAAHWKTRASFLVTSDQTDAEASLNSVAGAFLTAGITTLYYCWVQIGGLQAVVVDTTQTAGAALIATTTDLTLVAGTTNTKGNQLVYAIAYGTAPSTTSANVYWVFGNLL
jgi:hypothetical protein